jgi:hypothetical protein
MELSSPMLNPSVPPQQIPPDELWFGPSPGEFDKTSLTMEGRTVGRSPVRRPGGGGCRRRLACASAGVGATPIEGRLCPCRTLDAWGGRAFGGRALSRCDWAGSDLVRIRNAQQRHYYG